jgi:cell wall-associated NlpC family hydrolase
VTLLDWLWQAGFRGKGLRTAWAIAMRESGGDPRALNDNSNTGDLSYGLFQINMIGGLGPSRRQLYNLKSNDELLDPATNAKVAYRLSAGGKDFGAWGWGPNAYRRSEQLDSKVRQYMGMFPERQLATLAGGTAPPVPSPARPQAARTIPTHVVTPPRGRASFATVLDKHLPRESGAERWLRAFRPISRHKVPEQGQWVVHEAGQYASEKMLAQRTGTRQLSAVRGARKQLGKPYVWGASNPKVGFDCSGLIKYIAKKFYGRDLPHHAASQYRMGKRVKRQDLLAGDAVFFNPKSDGPGHVGIYIGSGQFLHASSGGSRVMISELDTYPGEYMGARRYV